MSLQERLILPRNCPKPSAEVTVGDPVLPVYRTDPAPISAPVAESSRTGELFPTESTAEKKSGMGVAALAIGVGAALLLFRR